jgi:hypothetical protein
MADCVVKVSHHLAMRIVRDLSLFEYSSAQLITISFLDLGFHELLESHRATMVGRADAERRGDGGHESLVLLSDEKRESVPRIIESMIFGALDLLPAGTFPSEIRGPDPVRNHAGPWLPDRRRAGV